MLHLDLWRIKKENMAFFSNVPESLKSKFYEEPKVMRHCQKQRKKTITKPDENKGKIIPETGIFLGIVMQF